MTIEALEPLVGEWTTAVTLPGAKEPVTGRTSFAWLEGGGYLVQRAVVDDPRFPNGIMAIGPDPGGKRIVQHYFDSRGITRIYDVELAGGVWRLSRDAPGFAQRFTGRFSDDGATIEGAWEKCEDGTTWVHDFDLTYIRVA